MVAKYRKKPLLKPERKLKKAVEKGEKYLHKAKKIRDKKGEDISSHPLLTDDWGD